MMMSPIRQNLRTIFHLMLRKILSINCYFPFHHHNNARQQTLLVPSEISNETVAGSIVNIPVSIKPMIQLIIAGTA